MKFLSKILAMGALLLSDAAQADQPGRKHAENELHAQPGVHVTGGWSGPESNGQDNARFPAAGHYVGGLAGGVWETGPGASAVGNRSRTSLVSSTQRLTTRSVFLSAAN